MDQNHLAPVVPGAKLLRRKARSKTNLNLPTESSSVDNRNDLLKNVALNNIIGDFGRNGVITDSVIKMVKLERVLGLTTNSSAALSCDSQNGVVAYAAGCTVVLYSSKKNKQAHIINASKKTITCLTFTADGRHLATGESGHQPAVRVWDTQEGTQVAEFLGHKYGVNCVAFSPSMKYLVSIGTQHDMGVFVWNWKSNSKVAANKVSCKVKAVSFAESGGYFVTVGIRHVKFWYLERNKASPKYQDTVPLSGRSAILADQRNNYFCDVVCGRGSTAANTYCITQSGLLCEFNSKRLLERWVELKTTSANSLSISQLYIFVGCAEGVVRVFGSENLHYIATLPFPHYLGVDVASGLSTSHVLYPPPQAKYPDAVAVCFDEKQRRLTCVYNDHSLYVWDVSNLERIGKAASFLYHSACIWNIELYPNLDDVAESGSKTLPALPPGTFITCSSDNTIRFWNLELPGPGSSGSISGNFQATPSLCHGNIYSPELMKVIYVGKDLQYLCDVDYNPSGQSDKVDTQYDGKSGVRTIVVSHDGAFLASGDRTGNLRVFNLHSMQTELDIEAHDSEILCLEFSRPKWGQYLLASSSRDRLIHVFDVNRRFEFVNTLDEHSSSITAVKFAHYNKQLHLLSCGADKSVIFRQVSKDPDWQFSRVNHVVGKTSIYDMDIDPGHQFVYTACQDRQIRVYSLVTGKCKRSFKGSLYEDGALIKLQLDDSGIYAASSCSDKQVYIVEASGKDDCVATMCGHSEFVTGLKFTHDCRRIITVSGDGCIFVWRLSTELSNNMLNKLSNLQNNAAVSSLRPPDYGVASGQSETDETDETHSPVTSENNFASAVANKVGFQQPDPIKAEDNNNSPAFSLSGLPAWARKQMGNGSTGQTPSPAGSGPQPQGKWANRAGSIRLAINEDADSADNSYADAAQDEVFMGPGSMDLIHQQFIQDEFEKSPVGLENARLVSVRSNRNNTRASFGSVSNVRLFDAENDGRSNGSAHSSLDKSSPAIIYFNTPPPSRVAPDGSQFEVKERSEMVKSHHTSSGRLYGRSESNMGELSDDEGEVGASNPNLLASLVGDRRSMSVSTEELNVGGPHAMLKAAFETLDQPDSCIAEEQQQRDAESMERGTPLRQSITSRFLQRSGSGRLISAGSSKDGSTSAAPSSMPRPAVNLNNDSFFIGSHSSYNSTPLSVNGSRQFSSPSPAVSASSVGLSSAGSSVSQRPVNEGSDTPRRAARWLPAAADTQIASNNNIIGGGTGAPDSRPSSSTSTLSGPSTDRSESEGFGLGGGQLRSALMNSRPQMDVARLNRIAAQSSENLHASAEFSLAGGRRTTPPVGQAVSRLHIGGSAGGGISSRQTPPSSFGQASTSSAPAAAAWSYRPPPPPVPPRKSEYDSTPPGRPQQLDSAVVRRARSLNQLARDKNRRRTLPEIYFLQQDNILNNSIAEVPEGSNSRSRNESQSPVRRSPMYAQQQQRDQLDSTDRYHASQHYAKHNAQTAAFSQTSNLSRLNSKSLGALNQSAISAAATPNVYGDSNPMLKRISDLRDKLKKSTENLSVSPAELERLSRQEQRTGASSKANNYFSARSKSFGNIVVAANLGASSSRYDDVIDSPSKRNAGGDDASSSSNLARASSLARSLNSLHMLTKGHGAISDHRATSSRRSSQTDLSSGRLGSEEAGGGGVEADELAEADDRVSPNGLLPEPGSFYDKAMTLPRPSRRANSALMKKAQTVRNTKSSSHHNMHVDRMSGSGDSDSCESGPVTAATGNPAQIGDLRRSSTSSDCNNRYSSPRRVIAGGGGRFAAGSTSDASSADHRGGRYSYSNVDVRQQDGGRRLQGGGGASSSPPPGAVSRGAAGSEKLSAAVAACMGSGSNKALSMAAEWERRNNQQQQFVSPPTSRTANGEHVTGSGTATPEAQQKRSYLAKLLTADANGNMTREAASPRENSNTIYDSASRRRSGSEQLVSGGNVSGGRLNGKFSSSGEKHGDNKSFDGYGSVREKSENAQYSHYEKMSRHCQDSLGEFKTSLDKVLQAYQLVNGDNQLSDKERDILLGNLNIELEAAYKRIVLTLGGPPLNGSIGVRTEPEGSHVDEVSSNHNLSNATSMQSLRSGAMPPFMPMFPPAGGGGGNPADPAALLQQYSELLVNMISAKMQK